MSGPVGVVRVSSKRPFSAFVFEAKQVLRQQETVELHGVGEAITYSVRATDVLCANGYAELQKFETTTIEESDFSGAPARRAKVIIVLRRSRDFVRLDEEYEKQREARPVK
jgi:hypothetical protein